MFFQALANSPKSVGVSSSAAVGRGIRFNKLLSCFPTFCLNLIPVSSSIIFSKYCSVGPVICDSLDESSRKWIIQITRILLTSLCSSDFYVCLLWRKAQLSDGFFLLVKQPDVCFSSKRFKLTISCMFVQRVSTRDYGDELHKSIVYLSDSTHLTYEALKLLIN